MPCIGYKKLLSAYLDDELRAMERLRVETHLRACRSCRRYRAQIERTSGMVRGLDRLEAPRFAVRRLSAGAHAGSDRAARWERIRQSTSAPPRLLLRPIAFAALALMMVLALLQLVERLPEEPSAPAAGEDVADRIPPASGSEEPPEWLKREIARRVLEARAREGAPVPEVAAEEPAAEQPADEGPAAAAPPETRLAELQAPAPAATPTAADRPDDAAVAPPGRDAPRASVPEQRIAEARLDPGQVDPTTPEGGAASERPSDGERPAATTAAPVTTVVLLEPAADEPTAPGGSAEPSPGPDRRTRRAAAPPAAATREAGPAPVEIDAGQVAIAVLTEGSSGTLAFLEPQELAALRESGQPLRTASLREAGSRPEGVGDPGPPPPPDPDTRIVPPVVLQRTPLELGDRIDEVRGRGELAPLALQVTVTPDGEVEAAEAVTRSGLDWLDEAIAGAVGEWTFRPAERDGEAIAATLELVVEFELD